MTATTIQPMFDLFAPTPEPVETYTCTYCRVTIPTSHAYAHQTAATTRDFGTICRALAAATAPAVIWIESLGQGARCKGGVIHRSPANDLPAADLFLTRAREAWRHRAAEFEAYITAWARWVGALDYFTGDRVEAATYKARHDAGLSLMGLEGDAS